MFQIYVAFYSSEFHPDQKRMRTVDEDRLKVEKGVLGWFSQAPEGNTVCCITVTMESFADIAQGIAEELGVQFEVNSSWINRLKERHDITFKRICGKADLFTPLIESTLPDILQSS